MKPFDKFPVRANFEAMSLLRLCLALVFALWTNASTGRAANTAAALFLDAAQARPGDTVTAAVQLKMNPGWHTYWENPGDSGLATRIRWTLPPGVTNGPIQWPVPEKIVIGGETTYGYHGEIVLLVPLLVSSNAPAGPAKLSAKVSWLECEKLCLPGSATVTGEFAIGSESKSGDHTSLFNEARSRLAQPTGADARAFWTDSNPTNRTLVVEWKTTLAGADFFAAPLPDVTISAKTVSGQTGPEIRQIRVPMVLDGTEWPKEIAGILTEDAASSTAKGYALRVAIESMSTNATGAATSAMVAGTSAPAARPPLAASDVVWQLVLGFIGGLILNVMPCVLPVIALKILGVVGQNREDPRRVRRHGYAYGVGVVLSFVLMAVAVVGFRSVGVKLLWGSQFGSPVFLVILTALMTLVALSLFGVFEITLSGRVMDTANKVSSFSTEFFSKAAGGWGESKASGKADGGLADSFFNGVFATIMGVSCTAPVLSAAVGFALTQAAPLVFLMFISVGLGMATPYVLLSLQPAWLKFLPKPGKWMEKFKIAMGFPMLATAVWLFTVAAGIFPGRGLWLGMFLVLLAAAAWVYGEFIQRSLSRHGVAWSVFVVILGIAFGYVLEHELDWRNPPARTAMHGSSHPDGIAWQPWTPEAVVQAQAQGRTVLVDFTADWCINCQVNKRNAIEVPEVEAKLKELNTLPLLGDFTQTPDHMAQEILSHGRAGVPLVLVYPGKPGAAPEILPELFSKSRMLEALDRAAGTTAAN